MELKDLKINNKVELRNGERYKVVYNGRFALFVEENEKDYFESNTYRNDLTCIYGSEYDIVKVETLTKTIELNKTKKNNLDKLQKIADEMMEYVDNLDIDDEEIKEEREKLRKLYKQLKKKKNKLDGLTIDSVKYEKNGDTTKINIEGTGNLSDIIGNL